MNAGHSSNQTRKLLRQVTCPHCWGQFPPHEVLFVSEHGTLHGDTLLGETAQRRFRPTRFTVDGLARDAKGMPCGQMACPRCHLALPTACLELPALFQSIFGAPGSGKSYFLAAATWELRAELPGRFGISFRDADPDMNRSLINYEESLFASATDEAVPMANLIAKTEERAGDLHNFVRMGGRDVSLSRPFLFVLQPPAATPDAASLTRLMCLYDNAGESFQPGKDTADNPVTRHMARSKVLFFVFDPTQDSRFRRMAGIPTLSSDEKLARQEPVLQEAASRIRRHAGLSQSQRHAAPLVVILTKFDLWAEMIGGPDALRKHPLRTGRRPDGSTVAVLDLSRIHQVSTKLREMLMTACPEVVHAAEGFCEAVTFIATSAVGPCVQSDPATGAQAIRPADATPLWATVPFLYGLAHGTRGLVPAFKG